MSTSLVTAAAMARLAGDAGRGLVTMRGHHLVVDAPLALGGPNEEINPLDLMLAALSTCATFLCDSVAREQMMVLTHLRVAVAADFNPRGMCGDPVDPSIQALRLQLHLGGVTADQAQLLAQSMRARCPIFTTLARGMNIDVSVMLEADQRQASIEKSGSD